jgi:hypothetical protein
MCKGKVADGKSVGGTGVSNPVFIEANKKKKRERVRKMSIGGEISAL